MQIHNLIPIKKLSSAVATSVFLLAITVFGVTSALAGKHYKVSKPLMVTLVEDTVFLKVDKQPAFPGGFEAFEKFVIKNMKYPEVMHDRQIEDDVMVKFIVEADGSLSHFTALNSPGYGAADEAIRILKLSPKWNPGVKGGRNVRVLFRAPIHFRLRYVQHKDDNSTLKVIKE